MSENKPKIILDLCGAKGAWSKYYQEAGYDVRVIDILNGQDVRLLEFQKTGVYGILAAPPCDHLAGSGARWWKSKGEEALLDALSIVDACLRAVILYKPRWWCLENPVGRLSHFLGKPVMTFQPYEYGDPYQKRTCLWGRFTFPKKNPVEPTEGQKIWKMAPGSERKAMRSITPSGFARAFYEANK